MKVEVEAVAAEVAAQVESSLRLRTTEVLLQQQVQVGQVLLRLTEALTVLGEAASRQALSVVDAQLDGGDHHHMQGAGYRILPLEEAEANQMMALGGCMLQHACSE